MENRISKYIKNIDIKKWITYNFSFICNIEYIHGLSK